MSAEFIDSNVFIYLFDETAPDKRQAAQALIQAGLETGSASISYHAGNAQHHGPQASCTGHP